MGFLSSIFERRSVQSSHPKDPALSALFGGGSVTKSGQNVTSDNALAVSTVYACVCIIAQTIAMLPINVYRFRKDGGKDKDLRHSLYKLIQFRPNRFQTAFEFWELMLSHVLLRGNAYAYISSTGGKGLSELIPMHPDRIYPFIMTPDGTVIYAFENAAMVPGGQIFYDYYPLVGGRMTLRQDEVFHLKGLSSNGLVGFNPIQLHRETIGLSSALMEHGARLFSNGAQVGMAFSHPGKLGDKAFENLKKSLNDYTGVGNAHKTMILEEGLKIEKLGLSAEDAQFLESRKFSVEEVCRIFNIPPILVGHSDKASTYASAEQMFTSYVVHTLSPWFARIEQAITRDLIFASEQGKVFAKFVAAGMLRGDSTARSNFYRAMFNIGAFSVNDIRESEDYNPIENGDKHYVPLNMTTVDASPEKTQEPAE